MYHDMWLEWIKIQFKKIQFNSSSSLNAGWRHESAIPLIHIYDLDNLSDISAYQNHNVQQCKMQIL